VHSAIAELVRCAGSFGSKHAAGKLQLLESIGRGRGISLRDLLSLHDVLCFLRAYPDDPRVLVAVREVVAKLRGWLDAQAIDRESPRLENEGFPGGVNRYEFSLPFLQRLVPRFPDCFEIDWDALDDPNPLVNALGLLVTSAECQGLDDIDLELGEWFEACRPARHATDLQFLIALFTGARFDVPTRDQVYERCAIPIRFELTRPGTARSELAWPVESVHFQRRELDRKRRPPVSEVRRPFSDAKALGTAAGERMIDLAQGALSSRSLEIPTLSYANPRDVSLVGCGRGLQVALIGVVPRYRDPLEAHYCGLVLKNGVPIAYGPSSVGLGCCEIGLNLFPEFRGAEVRFIYPQFMRALYHLLGARYFFLTPYGMGRDNPAAIRTGAFWFYRKLGFLPTNPEVEVLARQEERRTLDQPGYRSTPAILRRMSDTAAYCDLSGGECRPLDLGAIGLRQSRFVAEVFGGDRRRAVRSCVSRTARVLGQPHPGKLPPERRRAWEMLAPLLAMIPSLERWGKRDKQRLLRILQVKGSPAERGVDRLIRAHRPLRSALHELQNGNGV